MRSLKLTSTIIPLLPVLAFLPLTNQLFTGLHIGGISILARFFRAAISPSTDPIVIQNSLKGMQVTIATASISWGLSLLIGICLGILSSNTFWETFNTNKSIGISIRRFLAIPRAVHELVWGLLLLQIMGLTPLVAIIAITIPYSALIARVISNQIDILNKTSLIAVKQTGAGPLSAFITSIIPRLIPTLSTYGLYRIECALRGATLLGIFGLGGIGTELQLTLQSLQFQELWTSLWILGAVMLILEKTTSLIRKSNLASNNSQGTSFKLIIIISTFIVINILSVQHLKIDPGSINFHQFELPSLLDIKDAFLDLPILDLITTTILLTIFSSGIAIGTPPLALLIFPGKLCSRILSIVWIFFRLVPPPLTAFLLLLCTNPSLSVGALALGINNMGVLGRLLNENLKNQNNSLFNAMKSSGASSSIAWLYGKFSQESESYLAFSAYRTDVVLRETAVVGMVGGMGLGWQLQESLSSFNWGQVVAITITFTTLTLLGESISDKISEYWLIKTTDISLKV